MNRAQRRLFNKRNKTHYTKEQFELMQAVDRIKNGNYNLSDLNVPKDFVHIDNEELVPNGTEVKLNFESLDFRCSHVDKTNELFRNWVAEAHKDEDKVYHITREGAKNSLVCLEEDDREVELDGKMVKAPKWLFDLMTDIKIKDPKDGEWKIVGEVEGAYFDDKYVEVQDPNKAFADKESEEDEESDEE